jgi:hypothetical protein
MEQAKDRRLWAMTLHPPPPPHHQEPVVLYTRLCHQSGTEPRCLQVQRNTSIRTRSRFRVELVYFGNSIMELGTVTSCNCYVNCWAGKTFDGSEKGKIRVISTLAHTSRLLTWMTEYLTSWKSKPAAAFDLLPVVYTAQRHRSKKYMKGGECRIPFCSFLLSSKMTATARKI